MNLVSQESSEEFSANVAVSLEAGCLDLPLGPDKPQGSVCSEPDGKIALCGETSNSESGSDYVGTSPSIQMPPPLPLSCTLPATVADTPRQVEAAFAMDQKNSEKAVKRARLCFLLALSTAALALGVAGFVLLSHTEKELAQKQFLAISKLALFNTQANTLRKRMGSMSLANTVSSANPDAAAYPEVYLLNFERIASDIIEARNGRHMAFAPLIYNVTESKLQEFEDFAYNYLEERFPLQNTGVKAVEGRGIWTNETTDGKCHRVTDASTEWGGKHDVVAPKLQHDGGDHPLLMNDFYKIRAYGESIDKMIDCATARRQTGNLNMECGVVSEMLFPENESPISRIFAPVYPAQNPFFLGGFATSIIVWDKVLDGVFDESVHGIDCVIKTETGQTTYRIRNGMAEFVAYNRHEKALILSHDVFLNQDSINIVLTGEGHFSETSPPYKMTISHTKEFSQVYATSNPMYAAVGAILAILLTSIGFIAYDKLVNRDIRLKKKMFLSGWNQRKIYEDIQEDQNLTGLKEEMFLLGWNERGRMEAKGSEVSRRTSSEEILESLGMEVGVTKDCRRNAGAYCDPAHEPEISNSEQQNLSQL